MDTFPLLLVSVWEVWGEMELSGMKAPFFFPPLHLESLPTHGSVPLVILGSLQLHDSSLFSLSIAWE